MGRCLKARGLNEGFSFQTGIPTICFGKGPASKGKTLRLKARREQKTGSATTLRLRREATRVSISLSHMLHHGYAALITEAARVGNE